MTTFATRPAEIPPEIVLMMTERGISEESANRITAVMQQYDVPEAVADLMLRLHSIFEIPAYKRKVIATGMEAGVLSFGTTPLNYSDNARLHPEATESLRTVQRVVLEGRSLVDLDPHDADFNEELDAALQDAFQGNPLAPDICAFLQGMGVWRVTLALAFRRGAFGVSYCPLTKSLRGGVPQFA